MIAVDLFAGAGGFTSGAEMAGVEVAACGNHWAEAIDCHARNHPNVQHIQANLLELDMARLPRHDLLLASPACQGHSSASQPTRRPKHEADRNTAWAVVCAAEAHRPDTILVENVKQMTRWPLFSVWRSAFEALGYVAREHVFDTADFGVPQNRRRLVVSFRRGEALDLVAPGERWVGFGDLVDWDEGEWRPITAKSARVPVRRGRARGLGRRFLIHYSSDNAGRELDRPIGTITTKRQWAAVDGDRSRMLSVEELRRGMAFPDGYWLPDQATLATKLLGNAIPPRFAAELVRQAAA